MSDSPSTRYLLTLLSLCLLTGTLKVLAQAYQITDLGSLPGQTTSTAVGINQAGQIAGYSGTRSFIYRKRPPALFNLQRWEPKMMEKDWLEVES